MPPVSHAAQSGADLHTSGPYRAVRVAVTTSVALATAVEDGDTLDGVVLNSADDVGLFGQTDPTENGVYTVAASGAPTRATWFNSNATMRRDLPIVVREGTLAGHVFVHATETTPIVPGTTDLVFVDTTGGGGAGVTYGTPALTLGTANAAGSTDEAIRRDATILAFDGTSPSTQAFGDAAAAGAATVAARRDHKHAMPANPITAHEAAGDPHPGYLTAAEGNAAYEATGAVAAHTGDAADAHDASAVSYDNTTSGLTATNVQDAIDEVEAAVGGGGHAEDHDHDGSPTQKLAQANTHESPDTDTGTSSLHHTLGTGANQAAAGNHSHGGGGGGLYSAYVLVKDEKTAGTEGGAFTSGAWRTRDLNTEVVDSGNHASLSSNQLTLDAGTWDFRITCPAFDVDSHQARLQNVTDATTAATGTSEFTSSANNPSNHSFVVGSVTIAASKTFEVQHRCQTTRATNGFGAASNAGFTVDRETYTIAEFFKRA
jgi:hypothetical protein